MATLWKGLHIIVKFSSLAGGGRGVNFEILCPYRKFFFVVEYFFCYFQVLPVIVFFSCAISVLYYVGAMQVVIGKIAWVMRVSLGTSAPESLCAAGNIFIGQVRVLGKTCFCFLVLIEV